MDPKWTQMIFCLKLQRLKVDFDYFLGGESYFEVFGPSGIKRGQNEAKMRFFKFYEKFNLRRFLIFCIKL